jgi:hypothetical protein
MKYSIILLALITIGAQAQRAYKDETDTNTKRCYTGYEERNGWCWAGADATPPPFYQLLPEPGPAGTEADTKKAENSMRGFEIETGTVYPNASYTFPVEWSIGTNLCVGDTNTLLASQTCMLNFSFISGHAMVCWTEKVPLEKTIWVYKMKCQLGREK